MTADLMELVREWRAQAARLSASSTKALSVSKACRAAELEICANALEAKLATLAPLEAGEREALERMGRRVDEGRLDKASFSDAEKVIAVLRRLTTTPAPSAVAGGRKKNAPILPIPVCGDCGAEGHERHADACQLTPTPEPKAGALAGDMGPDDYAELCRLREIVATPPEVWRGWQDLCRANSAIVDEIRAIVLPDNQPGNVVEAVRALASRIESAAVGKCCANAGTYACHCNEFKAPPAAVGDEGAVAWQERYGDGAWRPSSKGYYEHWLTTKETTNAGWEVRPLFTRPPSAGVTHEMVTAAVDAYLAWKDRPEIVGISHNAMRAALTAALQAGQAAGEGSNADAAK